LAESAQGATHGLTIHTIVVNHNPGSLLTQQ